MSNESTTRERPLPYWVGFSVYLFLIGCFVLPTGFWLYGKLMQPSLKDLEPVPAMPQVLASLGSRAPVTTGVQKTQGSNGQVSYTITSQSSVLTVSKSSAQPDWSFVFSYTLKDLMTPDQSAAANARFRLNADVAFARSLKVTEDQSAQLKQVPPVTTMIVSDADLALMKTTFQNYLAQGNSGTDQALATALEEVANRSLPATRKNIASRVKQIQSILKPEQIAPFKS